MTSPRSPGRHLSANGHTNTLRHLSRSPHPYHRTGSRNPESLLVPEPGDRSWPRTSSDSGTEADDESNGILKGLPAPPLRPRKGLRAGRPASDEYDWLPLLPPWTAFARSTSSSRSSEGEAEVNAVEAREKLSRKRRAEVLRRLAEIGLSVSVCVVVLLRERTRLLAWDWGNGMSWLIVSCRVC